MMAFSSEIFEYKFWASNKVDIGRKRSSNQDEVIFCPEYGFFAVADGMGGLYGGGETSAIIARVLPGMIKETFSELKKTPSPTPQRAAELLDEQVRFISDNICEKMNSGGKTAFGATLCAVWLIGRYAVFVNLGDSRGYLLRFYKKHIRQITTDHNVAAQLVANGELSKDEARFHPSSSSLTRFVGMRNPALPETFIEKLDTGDRILLCSDGLHGMVEDTRLPRLVRSSKSPAKVTEQLINEANISGGRDNISAVYIKVLGKRL